MTLIRAFKCSTRLLCDLFGKFEIDVLPITAFLELNRRVGAKSVGDAKGVSNVDLHTGYTGALPRSQFEFAKHLVRGSNRDRIARVARTETMSRIYELQLVSQKQTVVPPQMR
eukprot:m.186674 g.186674  ORF g.186674 m.186674 type:complete len:113 (+) comp32275_c4_seq7:409-747(+)